jgi:DNA-binding transcriptional ArsR family regulator
MPRASVTADVFNAIAEPRRRQIIELLAAGRGGAVSELAVNELVERLRIAQPAVSKHLAVLREVGLVEVARQGRERRYRLNAERLRAVYDWASKFEPFWSQQLDRIKQRAEQRARSQNRADNPPRKKGTS